jgi:hypothetical protein
MPGVLGKAVTDTIALPRLDGLAFDRFGNLFGLLEMVTTAGDVVTIDQAMGAVFPIALNIPGACRLDVHPNGDIYASNELPIQNIGGIEVRLGGLYHIALTCGAGSWPASGIATKLATVLDSPGGIQPLPADSAYGSAEAMLMAEDTVGDRFVRIVGDGTHIISPTGFDNIESVAFNPLAGDLYVGDIERSTMWRVRR